MADIETMYERLFLKAADLDKDYTLTIEKIDQEVATTERGKELAVVVYFKELKTKTVNYPDTLTGRPVPVIKEPKKFWLNKTNGRTIKGMYGDVKNWIGKKVTLYATTARGKGGQSVECIRVRSVVPTAERKSE